ncbi:MAG: invasion associated locus B family protein [Pseudomonadales bacterium]|nr:invasion associated locus B family protein [Pseudomonadales bacterium]
MIRLSRYLLLLATMGWGLNALGAQEIEASFGDWSKVCATPEPEDAAELQSQGKICQIVQTASQDESGDRLLQTTIGYVSASEQPILSLVAPLGIYLPKGIVISIDDTPITLPVQRSDGNGCMAYTTMNDSLIESMKQNDKGAVLVATNPNNNIKLPLSLKGFSEAFQSLKQTENAQENEP